MTSQERFHALMNFQPVDRLPLMEWATRWQVTLDRWYGEGLPVSITDRGDICRHFGMEVYKQHWFSVQKEDYDWPTSREEKQRGLVKDMDDYEKLRPHLFPEPAAVREKWSQAVAGLAAGDVSWFTLHGFFWLPRELFGVEPHLYAFYDCPELMHQINSDLADWQLKVIEEVVSVHTPDFMTFAEDMSYNHGPMVSKGLFDEFMLPYYQKVVPKLKEHGIRVIVDSDGDITEPAAWFDEAGIEGILPLERQAGVDVAKLREAHPKMLFIGCFDKMTMNKGEDAMRDEFERLLPVAAQGGLIISVDHQTPPGVSYQDYQLFLKLFAEYAKLAGEKML